MVLFGGLEIFGENMRARFEPVRFFEFGDIEQDAAADDAVGGDVDRAFAGTVGADFAGVEAVIHLAFPEDVAERVEMGIGEAVRRDGEIIGA